MRQPTLLERRANQNYTHVFSFLAGSRKYSETICGAVERPFSRHSSVILRKFSPAAVAFLRHLAPKNAQSFVKTNVLHGTRPGRKLFGAALQLPGKGGQNHRRSSKLGLF
jgi:hypothetical protein